MRAHQNIRMFINLIRYLIVDTKIRGKCYGDGGVKRVDHSDLCVIECDDLEERPIIISSYSQDFSK